MRLKFRQGMCCVIKLLIAGPRSHTELVRETGQREEGITRTLRALQADELIEPCGHRPNPHGGNSQLLYRWSA